MKESLIFFLIVSLFTFNVFCMNSSIFGPPPPDKIEFGECFFVPRIAGGVFLSALYSYRHICREKFTDNGPQLPEHEKNWYFVGRLEDLETLSKDRPKFDYISMKQSRIQLVLLRERIVEFVLASEDRKYQITFQSVQQRNAFYEIVNHGVNMYKAAPNKIGMLHEIVVRENRKIGINVEALQERIKFIWYITLKNDQGEPLLIFCQNDAAILRMCRSQDDKRQLLMQVHGMHYILTFSSGDEAKKFSDGLLDYVKALPLGRLHASVRNRFENNKITMDPIDV